MHVPYVTGSSASNRSCCEGYSVQSRGGHLIDRKSRKTSFFSFSTPEKRRPSLNPNPPSVPAPASTLSGVSSTARSPNRSNPPFLARHTALSPLLFFLSLLPSLRRFNSVPPLVSCPRRCLSLSVDHHHSPGRSHLSSPRPPPRPFSDELVVLALRTAILRSVPCP